MLNHFNGVQLSFQGSILGFEDLDMFIIESIENTPFAYLKSMENPAISFLMTSPFHWHQDYTIQLDNHLKKKLRLKKSDDALVLCIVTIRESLESSTINLLAPLVINVKQLVGSQYVLQQINYRTNSPLIINTTKEGEV